MAAILLVASVCSASGQVPDHIPSGSRVEDLTTPGMAATPGTQARSLHLLALGLIKEFEGWSAAAYNDPSNYCTIGYGHLVELAPCTDQMLAKANITEPLSAPEGEKLLQSDTISARRAILSLTNVNLNDQQFGALTSFVFNIGKGNFEKSTMLRLLRRGDLDAAATQFRRWTISKGKVYAGLVDRRACEEDLFRGTLRPGPGGTFKRANCQSSGAAPAGQPLIDIEAGE